MASIGLVLSGGGARGIAHVGVLKALDELGIKVSAISGSSAGAIMGAFYAQGYSPKEILQIIKENDFFSYSDLLWRKAGFFSMNNIRKVYKKYFPENSFEKLKIELFIYTTDIILGESVIFSHGGLIDAIIASSSVPVMFEPVKIGTHQLLDGGILNNFPLESLLKQDKIIGVSVNPINTSVKEIKIRNMMDRSFHLAVKDDVTRKQNQCAVFIEPPELSGFGMFDFDRAEDIVEIGYKTAMEQKENLLTLKL